MSGRLTAWLRQAHNAQACDQCSQAAERALKALSLALHHEPPRTHSIERMLHTIEALGFETDQLRQLPLKPLQPMITAATTAS